MRAQLMLCDYAQVAEGKLYITGGGISRITGPGLPMGFTVATLVQIPWSQTNRPIPFVLELIDQDGASVTDHLGLEIRLEGQLEVGRPLGLEHGVSIDSPMALHTGGLQLGPGRYTWRLSLDGATEDGWQQSFTMVG